MDSKAKAEFNNSRIHYFLEKKPTELTQDAYSHDKGYLECPKKYQ